MDGRVVFGLNEIAFGYKGESGIGEVLLIVELRRGVQRCCLVWGFYGSMVG